MAAAVLGLLLSGCAMFKPREVPPPPVSHLAPPTPAAVRIRITAEDARKIIKVPVGARFAVELIGIPTAGYIWEPAHVPANITKVDEATGPTSSAQLQPGFTGGQHWEVTVFQAERAGADMLTLEQRRPWEKDTPPADTFEVTIEVK